jgi:glycogen phosphorylase
VARMRESMAQLTPRFSANRTVREYTEQYYLPAAVAYLERAMDEGALARQMVDWMHALEQKWSTIRFGDMKVETDGELHVFELHVDLNGLDPNAVRVELYAERVNSGAPVRREMMRGQELGSTNKSYVYSAKVPATRAAADYTVRVTPHRPGIAIPLEFARILWQR